MKAYILSDSISVFYLTIPDEYCYEFPFPIFCPFTPSFSKQSCPGYMPYVKDSNCRLCGKKSIHHRKYFVYSMLAFKIQKLYYKYKFKKFVKRLKMENVNIDPIKLLRYKLRFRKHWRIEGYKSYVKN